jgi:hypothetical protein
MDRVSPAICFMSAAISATLTVATCIGLERWQESQHKELLAAHERNLATQKERFELEDVKFQIEARDAAVARQRRHAREFTAALGGSVNAALKNPDVTILGMLQELAHSCAGRGSFPHVAVDRFTEFTVLLDLSRRETNAALAEIARCFLAHSAPYVHSLRFSHRGAVLAQLDRRAIESIPDWAKTTSANVESLLVNPEYSEPPTFVGAVPQTEQAHEPQNLPEELQRQKTAEEHFREAFKRANTQLHSALEQQTAAINLAGVKVIADLDARRKTLTDANRAAAEAKRVLANPVLEYERILQQQKLDPVYIIAATRTASQTHSNSRPAVSKVFAAIDERSHCASEVLIAVKRHFGAWTYQAFQDRIDFDDPLAHRDYAAAIKNFDAASREVEKAIGDWGRVLSESAPSEQKGTP